MSLVPDEHAPIAQLDRAFDYESKGHRFESCWVHHKPLTCFAPLAVFLFYRISGELYSFILFILQSCFYIREAMKGFGDEIPKRIWAASQRNP